MQVIVADDQQIFREGLVRVLRADPGIGVVAECEGADNVTQMIMDCPKSIVLFSSGFATDAVPLLNLILRAGARAVLILEQNVVLDAEISAKLSGIIRRSVAKEQLLECIYRVASGGRFAQCATLSMPALANPVASTVVRRLTPKEMQIIALVSEGCKNKEIALELGTREQVIKNYLRTIYSKCGVSDRLELALFTLRHQLLSKAIEDAQPELARSA